MAESEKKATASADTLEDRFAKDLIRFALHEHMIGLNWIPTGVFVEKAIDSPFTAQWRAVVRSELERKGPALHQIYDTYFPDKTKVKEDHYTICKERKDHFVQRPFEKADFIRFCALLAQFAGLSYLYGAQNAPYDSYILLVTVIRELKKFGKIGDTFWNEMQNWFENQ